MKNYTIAFKKSLPVLLTICFILLVQSGFAQDAAEVFREATDAVNEGISFLKVVFGAVLILGALFLAWAYYTNNPKKNEILIGFVIVLVVWGLIMKYAK